MNTSLSAIGLLAQALMARKSNGEKYPKRFHSRIRQPLLCWLRVGTTTIGHNQPFPRFTLQGP